MKNRNNGEQANARFWIYWNEPTKITLRYGQKVTLRRFSRTDEGWACVTLVLTHLGNRVLREWIEDGVDCDGRLTLHGSDWCYLDGLAEGSTVDANGEPEFYPDWQDEMKSQRDYAAEAAGY